MPHPSSLFAPGNEPLPVRRVPVTEPLVWLHQGVHDLTRAVVPSLLHGLIVAVGGIAILLVALHAWPIVPGAFSGFVLVGPILATGLYEISRRLARGEPARVRDALDAWRRGTRPLVWLGVLLGIAATMWVALSIVLAWQFVPRGVASLSDFLRHFVVEGPRWIFPLWVYAGGLGAAIVFACTAVSVPLLLDRRVRFWRAILTSVRAVGENPWAMLLWAAIIMTFIAVSMLTLMIGFVVAVPVVGHATWHAYRALVVTDGLPERTQDSVVGAEHTILGFTEAQIADFGVTFGVGAFIAYMLFIIWSLARQSKAGRFGTFVLFFVLSFGMLGFIAKAIIAKLMGI